MLASRVLWEAIRALPTVGVIRHDERRRLYDIAWPMGVIAALTPSTNPTSTVIFKTLIAVKARNALVGARETRGTDTAERRHAEIEFAIPCFPRILDQRHKEEIHGTRGGQRTMTHQVDAELP